MAEEVAKFLATKKEFEQAVSETSRGENKRPLVVYFTASWCGPCKKIRPQFEMHAADYDSKLVLRMVDIETNTEVMEDIDV